MPKINKKAAAGFALLPVLAAGFFWAYGRSGPRLVEAREGATVEGKIHKSAADRVALLHQLGRAAVRAANAQPLGRGQRARFARSDRFSPCAPAVSAGADSQPRLTQPGHTRRRPAIELAGPTRAERTGTWIN